jgi:hypothetical protein
VNAYLGEFYGFWWFALLGELYRMVYYHTFELNLKIDVFIVLLSLKTNVMSHFWVSSDWFHVLLGMSLTICIMPHFWVSLRSCHTSIILLGEFKRTVILYFRANWKTRVTLFTTGNLLYIILVGFMITESTNFETLKTRFCGYQEVQIVCSHL